MIVVVVIYFAIFGNDIIFYMPYAPYVIVFLFQPMECALWAHYNGRTTGTYTKVNKIEIYEFEIRSIRRKHTHVQRTLMMSFRFVEIK